MPERTLPEVFRDNLLSTLRKDGRPVKAIALISGYSESHIRRIVDGRKPNPTLRCVQALAETLGIDPTDLLRDAK